MSLPTEPLLAQQWHLINDRAGEYDLNLRQIWAPSAGGLAYSGAGISVFVIDDGFDFRHPDLAPHYDLLRDRDYASASASAIGNSLNSHGTAVMGLIGAAAQGSGLVGVAFDAQLVGYRIAARISDLWLGQVAQALQDASRAGADVVNISQSIANDRHSHFGHGYDPATFAAIAQAIGDALEHGRHGLGTSLVKSAGNGRALNSLYADYAVNADPWSHDSRQIVVAAVNRDGWVSPYSSHGPALLISGFGAMGEVLTTDRSGAAGYETGDSFNRFSGTSAAAPMVVGVVALMLQAAPALGWRDVQAILAYSARHIGSDLGQAAAQSELHRWQWNAASDWNGGGLHYSNDYGFGLIDAHAAVRLAETWLASGQRAASSANQKTSTLQMLSGPLTLPDGDPQGQSFAIQHAGGSQIERMVLQLQLKAAWMPDLRVVLTSPAGTQSELLFGQGGQDFAGSISLDSQAFRGENAGGIWRVTLIDTAVGDAIRISRLTLQSFGAAGQSDRYIFTDEYSDSAGAQGHRTSLIDRNGGNDSINAAAVTTASVIRLEGGSSRIDGVASRFFGIENAIGGDGNDLLRGSSGANGLWGGRGNDTLYGGDGADSLYGGAGQDILRGGAGADWLYGGSGVDLASYSGAAKGITADLAQPARNTGAAKGDQYHQIEGVIGSDFNDRLNGNGGANRLYGGAGDDWLCGGAGNDQLTGGAGRDVFVFMGGRDVITDFSLGLDQLQISRDFAGPSATAAQIAALLTPSAAGLMLEFGPHHQLLLAGLQDAAALAADLLLI